MLFSVASICYTLSCPLIGILAARERFGPRPIIVTGACMLVGWPSRGLGLLGCGIAAVWDC